MMFRVSVGHVEVEVFERRGDWGAEQRLCFKPSWGSGFTVSTAQIPALIAALQAAEEAVSKCRNVSVRHGAS